jgi:hypothetical protein
MAFKLPNQSENRFTRSSSSKDEAAPGTPILRKPLDEGIKAEANDDGSVFLDISIEPGSEEERQILIHEMVHITDMKTGKLSYTDDAINYMGNTYLRANGKIYYEGKWQDEGTETFPWENHFRMK